MPPKRVPPDKSGPRMGTSSSSRSASLSKSGAKGTAATRAPSKLQKSKKLKGAPLPDSSIVEPAKPKEFVPFEPPYPYTLVEGQSKVYGFLGRHSCTLPNNNTTYLFDSFCVNALEDTAKEYALQRFSILKDLHHEGLRTYQHFYSDFKTSSGDPSDYLAVSWERAEQEGHTLDKICEMYRNKGQILSESTLWDIAAQLFRILALLHSPLEFCKKGGASSMTFGNSSLSASISHANISIRTITCSYSSRSDYELCMDPPSLSGYRWDLDGSDLDVNAPLVLLTPVDDIRAAGRILYDLASVSDAGNIPLSYSSSLRSLLRTLNNEEPGASLPSAAEILLLREIQGVLYRRTAPSEEKLHDLLAQMPLKVDAQIEPDISPELEKTVEPDEDGNTPLHLAVINANLDNLRQLKVYAGRTNKDGNTALMLAVKMDAVDVVRELAPLECNRFLLDGTTALGLALELEHLECAAILLKYEGLDNRVANIDVNGVTDLMRAAENGDLVGAWSWLSRQCKYMDNHGQTAFMRAAATGNLKLCRLLMQSEAGMCDINGRTALMHYAISGGEISLDDYECYHATCPNSIKFSTGANITSLENSCHSTFDLTDLGMNQASMLSTISLGTSTDLRKLKDSRFRQKNPVNHDLIQLLCSLEGKMTDKNGRNALYLAIAVNNMQTALALIPYEGPEPVYLKEEALSVVSTDDDRVSAIPERQEHHISSLDNHLPGFTDLMEAALEGDVYRAFCFMQTQAKRFDSSGFSALMYASRNNSVMLCRLLAIQEAKLQAYVHTNPNNFYSCNRTALMVAAEAGHVDCVKILAPHEARLTDSEGKTALMYAASKGHENVVMELLQQEGGINTGRFTATSYAIMNGHYKLAKTLYNIERTMATDYEMLSKGLPNNSDAQRTTPLMLAAKAGDIAAVFHLRNQYMKKVDKNGMTALLFACEFGCKYCIQLLKDEASLYRKSDGLTARALVEKQRLIECYEYIPPVCVRDGQGNTQLHRAVLNNNMEDLKCYLHLAGEINFSGATALMLAAAKNNVEAVNLLAEREAGLTAKKYKVTNLLWTEVSAMMIAAACGHGEIVEKLLAKESKLSEKTEGRTALIAAAALGRANVVQILAPYESKMQKYDGWTALMYASAYGYSDCIEPLLCEARIAAVDGWTALMCAAKNGHTNIVEHLVSYEKEMVKSRKYPALYYALVNGHMDCAKVLLPYEYSVCKSYIMHEVKVRKNVSHNILKELTDLLQAQEQQNISDNDKHSVEGSDNRGLESTLEEARVKEQVEI